MTQHEIRLALHEFILDQFPAARGLGLQIGDSLLDQGIIDSLGILDIVAFIEKQFGVALTDDDLVADHFESIPALANLLREKMCLEESCKS